MKVHVGSTNKSKIDAVAEILKEYPHLADAEVIGVQAESNVGNQPLTLDDTVRGATNRAKASFHDCELSIGIESGLMVVPGSKSGYMDVCVCAIYDGDQFHIGLSSAWEFPDQRITRSIVEEGLDMAEAVNRAGLTTNPSIGSHEGAIGILTKGRVDRKAYTKEALRMALIHIDE
jgi:inosine/xanthosine triphosphatase